MTLSILVNSLEQLKYPNMIWLKIYIFKMCYYIVIVVTEEYLKV